MGKGLMNPSAEFNATTGFRDIDLEIKSERLLGYSRVEI